MRFLPILALLVACGPKTKAVSADPGSNLVEALQGTWLFSSVDGQTDPEVEDIRWVFDGASLTEFENENPRTSSFSLDTASVPARLTLSDPPAIALVKIEAEILYVQLNDRTNDWPTDFSVEAPHLLLALRRAP